jgi:parvulin-like peptidyl-prolyl isomerase
MGVGSARGARAQAALLLLVAVAGILLSGGCQGAAGGGKAVAVVNGEALSEEEFHRMCEQQAPETLQPGGGTVGMQVLGAWIGNTVIAQEARRLNVYPSEEELNKRVEEARRQYEHADSNLERALAQQGSSLEAFRRSLLHTMIQEAVLLRGITVSDEEVRAEFQKQMANFTNQDAIRISQITVNSQEKARQAHSELSANADFALVAGSYSQDMFKGGGGKVPRPVSRNMPQGSPIARQVIEAAFKLQPGQISDPIKVGATWVIVRLDEKVPRKEPQLQDAQETIRSMLRRRKAAGSSVAQENQRLFLAATQTAKIQVNRPEYQQLTESSGGMPPSAPAAPAGGVPAPGSVPPPGATAPPGGGGG